MYYIKLINNITDHDINYKKKCVFIKFVANKLVDCSYASRRSKLRGFALIGDHQRWAQAVINSVRPQGTPDQGLARIKREILASAALRVWFSCKIAVFKVLYHYYDDYHLKVTLIAERAKSN